MIPWRIRSTKKQEECDSYDYSHQDTNEHYGCNSHANSLLTNNPYDIAGAI